jgi:DNA-directed RNA polymerase specialized sigma24 family protein
MPDPTPREDWQRVAAELSAHRAWQRQTWGDLDDTTLGRYLAGEATPEECGRVEAAAGGHPTLRELLSVVREVLGESEEPAPEEALRLRAPQGSIAEADQAPAEPELGLPQPRLHLPLEQAQAATGSVTHWIHQLEAGDRDAAQRLWERYIDRLARLAGQKLRGVPGAANKQDVALSAFDSFCRGAAGDRFPQLNDRDDLWALLVRITERKVNDRARSEGRQNPADSPAGTNSTLSGAADASGFGSQLDPTGQPEPTPEFAAQAAEVCQRLMDRLGDDDLRQIAVWKMEGYTNPEIAERAGCALPAVDQRLRLIRKTWEQEAA